MINKQDVFQAYAQVAVEVETSGNDRAKEGLEVIKGFITQHVMELSKLDSIADRIITAGLQSPLEDMEYNKLSEFKKEYVYEQWGRHWAGVAPI